MEVQLDITIENGDQTMEISKTVDEGEPVVLSGEGDSNWKTTIVPEEVIQVTDIKDDTEQCPVCGDSVKEIALANHIGDSLEMNKMCIGEWEGEGRDFLLYHHQQQ